MGSKKFSKSHLDFYKNTSLGVLLSWLFIFLMPNNVLDHTAFPFTEFNKNNEKGIEDERVCRRKREEEGRDKERRD